MLGGCAGCLTGAKDLAELMKKQGPMAIVIGVVLLVAALAVMQHIGKRALRAAGIG